MVGPLKIIVELAEMLASFFNQNKLPSELKKIVQTILISSKLVLFHSNDLLDQRIIQSGAFVPSYSHGSVADAIDEII